MVEDKIHIVMAADGTYRKGLEVAKASLSESCAHPERLVFHLFDGDAAFADRVRREFGTYKGSTLAFLRLYLGELLPDVDWVVYSDVDTIWRRDVAELWELRDENATIQWVRDLKGTVVEFKSWCAARGVPLDGFDPGRYCCSGVCLVNLKRWRERNVLDRCREFAARFGCPKYADQDILNAILGDEAALLPDCWDVLVPSPENSPRCVLHLTGVGRCFAAPYDGRVAQYLYWQRIAHGTPFKRPLALPFYLREWMIRLCFPFAGAVLCDRIRRHFAWRWFVRRHFAETDHDERIPWKTSAV